MFYYLNNKEIKCQSARVAISGPDANTYLQGQFTQDLRGPIGGIFYGLWLNQKGRPLAESTVARCSETDFLILSKVSAPSVIQRRLEDYLVADEVVINDESGTWEWLALIGDEADSVILREIGAVPAPGRFVSAEGVIVHAGRNSTQVNFDVWLRRDRVAAWVAALAAAGAVAATGEDWTRERIRSGLPVVPTELGVGDLPAEGGLDAVAISYTKGCYLGQEVMARLKNLGQVRRGLHVVRGEGAVPVVGAELQQAGRRVGEVRAAVSDDAGWLGFAMLSLVGLRPEEPLALAPAGGAVTVVRHV